MKKILPTILLVLFTVVVIAKNSAIINLPLELRTSEIANTNKHVREGVPAVVQTWLEGEIAKSRKEPLADFQSPNFFSKDTARLVGYLKGYDKSLGFTTGLTHATNQITGEDFPIVVAIHSDGRFEASIPMNHPIYTSVTIKEAIVKFYIEPGQILGMVLGRDEFIKAERSSSSPHIYADLKFSGTLAKLNEELISVPVERSDYETFKQKITTLTPPKFKESQLAFWKESSKKLERIIKAAHYSTKTRTILRNEVILDNAVRLLDYVNRREYEVQNDTVNQVLKAKVENSYYTFLKGMPLNDQSLLVSRDYSTFINLFEYSEPFSLHFDKGTENSSHSPSFDDYLFEGLRLKKTSADSSFLAFHKEFWKKINKVPEEQRDVLFKEYDNKYKPFMGKYKKFAWKFRDSILSTNYGLKPSLSLEIAVLRSLKYDFEKVMNNDDARIYLTSLKKEISTTFLKQESERMFIKAYPTAKKAAYVLPEGRGAEIFKKIIDPHKGKVLFVDFWSIYCVPCVASIKKNKSVRAQYKDHKDLDFVFITPEDESPLIRYNKFVAEQELVISHRLNATDYSHLKELFKFAAIPRCVIIDKEGKVLNDDFEMSDFEAKLAEILADN